ncbi:MAG TPA: hypothetical protein VJ001_06265 [Rhodocyclaceae bacterium]|nr:hypothetical protein [Rhodocyclaceae bacterium]
MGKLNDLQALVQDAIDKGATNIEEVHKTIGNMPFDVLAKIAPLEGMAENAKELHTRTIGSVYEAIRVVNQKAGEIAARLLGQGK